MSFASKLKDLMNQRNLSQKDLRDSTGLSAASISQYLAGKNEPKRSTVKLLADALDTSAEYLEDQTDKPEVSPEGLPCGKMTVEEAARRMGKSAQFVRVSLQRGTAPFGFAVQMESGKWCYHISPKKFADYIG